MILAPRESSFFDFRLDLDDLLRFDLEDELRLDEDSRSRESRSM